MKRKVIRFLLWVVTAIFLLCALPFFPSFSSLIFLLGAALVAPLPRIRDFLRGRGLTAGINVLLAAAIFVGGVMAAPKRSTLPEPKASIESVTVKSAPETGADISSTFAVTEETASETGKAEKGTVRPASETATESASIPGVPTAAELEAAAKAEEERLAAEAAREAEEARKAEEERQAEAARKAEEARQAEEARKAEEERQAEEARKAEEARQAEEARKAEEARQAEEARKAEEARQAEEARKAEEERQAEEARKAEEARQAEEARKAEEERQAEEARGNHYDNPEQQKTADTYVINTNTKKIHYPSCRDVKKIAPKNYDTSNKSVAELEAEGYSPCGHCRPR